ncbi:glycosyl transferase [Clostridia bacterium]|nr:glycosyl transferase [Clostridia bacterium]
MAVTNREIIPIFFATDDNYAPLLAVALRSLCSQASDAYDYRIHILCENLNDENKRIFAEYGKGRFRVFITDMTERIAARAGQMHTRDYYSKTTYFRVYIPNMFPEYKKAIYLDCDIALNADISEFYRFDIGDNYVGAVTCEAVDTTPVFTEYAEKYLGMNLPMYFNAGVLLMNLEVLRNVKFEDRFFDILSKVKFEVAQDQDYLNVLCKSKVVFLPKVWNKIPIPIEGITSENVKLAHYNLALRPWRYDGVLFGDLFWKHAEKTAVYGKLKEMKRNFSERDAAYDRQWMENLQRLAASLAVGPDRFIDLVRSGKLVLIQ